MNEFISKYIHTHCTLDTFISLQNSFCFKSDSYIPFVANEQIGQEFHRKRKIKQNRENNVCTLFSVENVVCVCICCSVSLCTLTYTIGRARAVK